MIQKTQFGGLIVTAILAATIITAFSFTTMYTVAQNATSGKNATAVRNMTKGSTTSSSSCGTGSTASSCYDVGYQNALANPGYLDIRSLLFLRIVNSYVYREMSLLMVYDHVVHRDCSFRHTPTSQLFSPVPPGFSLLRLSIVRNPS